MKRKIKSPVPTTKSTDGTLVSEQYLVLCETKSSTFWRLARWNSGFIKTQPWRNLFNNPVDGRVIGIYELPPKSPVNGVCKWEKEAN